MSNVVLRLENIHKTFDGEAILKGINLTVEEGEFITLLGASGCGKTTTLRIIAGLEQAEQGTVWLNGQDITGLVPNKRDVNTVFQNYALFPHMTVAENIGYGLKIRKKSKAEIKEMKNAHHIIIPNMGHASMYEDPLLFISLVLGFTNAKDTKYVI